jgi:hypothetical protein
VLIIAPPIVFATGHKKTVLRNLKDILNLSREDLSWLIGTLQKPFRKNRNPVAPGKFNAGQKVNTILTMLLLLLLSISGLSMLIIRGSLLSNVIHASLSLIFMCSVAGHLYLALIHPSTRPALKAIFTGRVNAEWLRKHHGRMYQGLEDFMYEGILFEEASEKRDLKRIYRKIYSTELSFKDFKNLAKSSELLFVAIKGEDLIGYCRVIGDGITKGYISDYYVDDIYNAPDFFKKMMSALAAKTGHKIYFIPKAKKPAFAFTMADKGTDGIELSSMVASAPGNMVISCLKRKELQKSIS